MKPVVWSAEAEQDYLDVLAWIAADNPFAAERVSLAVLKAANDLGEFATGRPGRVTGTYEKVIQRHPYILAYSLGPGASRKIVTILRVIHTARDWQPEEWPE